MCFFTKRNTHFHIWSPIFIYVGMYVCSSFQLISSSFAVCLFTHDVLFVYIPLSCLPAVFWKFVETCSRRRIHIVSNTCHIYACLELLPLKFCAELVTSWWTLNGAQNLTGHAYGIARLSQAINIYAQSHYVSIVYEQILSVFFNVFLYHCSQTTRPNCHSLLIGEDVKVYRGEGKGCILWGYVG